MPRTGPLVSRACCSADTVPCADAAGGGPAVQTTIELMVLELRADSMRSLGYDPPRISCGEHCGGAAEGGGCGRCARGTTGENGEVDVLHHYWYEGREYAAA